MCMHSKCLKFWLHSKEISATELVYDNQIENSTSFFSPWGNLLLGDLFIIIIVFFFVIIFCWSDVSFPWSKKLFEALIIRPCSPKFEDERCQILPFPLCLALCWTSRICWSFKLIKIQIRKSKYCRHTLGGATLRHSKDNSWERNQVSQTTLLLCSKQSAYLLL